MSKDQRPDVLLAQREGMVRAEQDAILAHHIDQQAERARIEHG